MGRGRLAGAGYGQCCGIVARTMLPLLLHSCEDASVVTKQRACPPAVQSPGMARAQELLRRLRHRDIYKHVGSVDIPHVSESCHSNCRFEAHLLGLHPAR